MCIHKAPDGGCDILSDGVVRQYCVEGPCPYEHETDPIYCAPAEEIDSAWQDKKSPA